MPDERRRDDDTTEPSPNEAPATGKRAYIDELHERLSNDPDVEREGEEFAEFLKERGAE